MSDSSQKDVSSAGKASSAAMIASTTSESDRHEQKVPIPVPAPPVVPRLCPPTVNQVPAALLPPTQPTEPQPLNVRKGKWTNEEEQFSDFLIDGFEKGMLEDCDNGATLRSYLSRKLNCAPMRVSKKYAGQGIGKHMYIAKRKSTAEFRSQHNRLEAAFHKSTLQQENMPGIVYRPDQARQVFPPTLAPGTLIPLVPQPSVLHAMSSLHGSALTQPSWLNGPSSRALPSHLSAQTYRNVFPHTSSVATAPPQIAPKPPASAQPVSTQRNLHAPKERNVARAPVAGTPASPSMNSLEVPDFLSGFDRVTAAGHGTSRSSQNQSSKSSGQDRSHLPPLVSLFANQPHSPLPASAQFTPTFTSRSFDDFHQLLGADCSPGGNPFNLDASSISDKKRAQVVDAQSLLVVPGVPGAPSTLPKKSILNGSSGAKNTADAYALFAQQSAMAVMSQHSAYSYNQGNASAGQQAHGRQGLSLLAPRPPNVKPPSLMNGMDLKAGSKPSTKRTDSPSSGTGIQPDPTTQSYRSQSSGNIVSVSDRSSEQETEESESAVASSRGSGSDGSNTATSSDNDNVSNDSDSMSEDGPAQKKAKTSHRSEGDAALEAAFREAVEFDLQSTRAE